MYKRYDLKYGKFGAYFFDSDEGVDLSLEDALGAMNDKNAGYAAGLQEAIDIGKRELKYFNKDGVLATTRINDKIDSRINAIHRTNRQERQGYL